MTTQPRRFFLRRGFAVRRFEFLPFFAVRTAFGGLRELPLGSCEALDGHKFTASARKSA